MEQKVEELRLLASDLNIRDARKLYQVAKGREYRDITQKMAAEALRSSVQRQVLAPPTRYRGHYAAVGPGEIQEDLIDFSNNTKKSIKPRFVLVGADVFSRKIAAEPLLDKKKETIYNVNADILHRLVGDQEHVHIRTDHGKEWGDLTDYADPLIHSYADLHDRNGLAVVDAAIKHIKRDLAAEVGKTRNAEWPSKLEKVVHNINEQPNPSVHGPPENVMKNKVQEFLVLKDNANKLAKNSASATKMQAAIAQSATEGNHGVIREPIDNGGRSFKPTYGKPLQVERTDAQYAYTKGHRAAVARGDMKEAEQHQVLLKHAQPATAGKFETALVTEANKSKLTETRLLQGQALHLENVLLREGSISVADIPKKLPGFRRLKRRIKDLTDTSWITKHYNKRFVIQDGEVRLRSRPSEPAPREPAPPAAPAPAEAAPPADIAPKKKRDAAYYRGLKFLYG